MAHGEHVLCAAEQFVAVQGKWKREREEVRMHAYPGKLNVRNRMESKIVDEPSIDLKVCGRAEVREAPL